MVGSWNPPGLPGYSVTFNSIIPVRFPCMAHCNTEKAYNRSLTNPYTVIHVSYDDIQPQHLVQRFKVA